MTVFFNGRAEERGVMEEAGMAGSSCPGCSVVSGEAARKPQQGLLLAHSGCSLQLLQWLGGAGPGLKCFL